MKFLMSIVFVGLSCFAALPSIQEKTVTEQSLSYEPIAVIELFTSQGCSSCPPADQLLGKIIAANKAGSKNLFALSFHVDYWNRLGWKDPFSQQAFSARQQNYAAALKLNSAYTPQVIVNGVTEFVGSNSAAMDRAIKNALNKPAAAQFSSLALKNANNNAVQISYTLEGDFEKSTINAALIKKTAITNVKRGENNGRQLTNYNVVQSFTSQRAAVSGVLQLNIKDLDRNHADIVLFVQKVGGQITGAIKTSLPK